MKTSSTIASKNGNTSTMQGKHTCQEIWADLLSVAAGPRHYSTAAAPLEGCGKERLRFRGLKVLTLVNEDASRHACREQVLGHRSLEVAVWELRVVFIVLGSESFRGDVLWANGIQAAKAGATCGCCSKPRIF